MRGQVIILFLIVILSGPFVPAGANVSKVHASEAWGQSGSPAAKETQIERQSAAEKKTQGSGIPSGGMEEMMRGWRQPMQGASPEGIHESMAERMKEAMSPKPVPFYEERTFLVAVTVGLTLIIVLLIKRKGFRPWRIRGKGASFVNEAILVVDLCESTRLATVQGDAFAMRIKNKMKDCVREVSEDFGASFFENIGDGYLITFPTALSAVRAAVKILQNADDYNQGVPEREKIELRIGVGYGEMVLDEHGQRHGAAINKTFRIESLQKGQLQNVGEGMRPEQFPEKNRIFISEELCEEIKETGAVEAQLVGVFSLKGFMGLHRVYNVSWKNSSPQ